MALLRFSGEISDAQGDGRKTPKGKKGHNKKGAKVADKDGKTTGASGGARAIAVGSQVASKRIFPYANGDFSIGEHGPPTKGT